MNRLICVAEFHISLVAAVVPAATLDEAPGANIVVEIGAVVVRVLPENAHVLQPHCPTEVHRWRLDVPEFAIPVLVVPKRIPVDARFSLNSVILPVANVSIQILVKTRLRCPVFKVFFNRRMAHFSRFLKKNWCSEAKFLI